MENQLKFRIQKLLSRKGDTISAPMSPLHFAKEMARQNQVKFNRLVRVWFDDETIHQRREDSGHTGHDTLIIAAQYLNDLYLSMWVDEGEYGIPVAMTFQSDRELIITTAYKEAQFTRKLSVQEIQEIFKYIFGNPSALDIKDEADSTDDKKDGL